MKKRWIWLYLNPPFGGKEKEQIQKNFPNQIKCNRIAIFTTYDESFKLGGGMWSCYFWGAFYFKQTMPLVSVKRVG